MEGRDEGFGKDSSTGGKETSLNNCQDIKGAKDSADLVVHTKSPIEQKRKGTKKCPEVDYSKRSERVKKRVDAFALNVGQIMKRFEREYGHVLNNKAMAGLLNRNKIETTAQKNGKLWHASSVGRMRKRLAALGREKNAKGPN